MNILSWMIINFFNGISETTMLVNSVDNTTMGFLIKKEGPKAASVARLEVNKDKNYPKNIKDIHSQIRIYGCQLVYLYFIYLVYR